MIGLTVGNYVVTEKLGEGGMGVVYLGRHPQLGRQVAIKVLHPERRRDARLLQRFANEARAASEIRNAHIVDVLDFGQLSDGTPYLVMELLEGRSLAALLVEEPVLELGRAVHIFRGIARALAAAHARGIVHRDLKPENIVLVPHGEDEEFAKVVDFGIAKLKPEGFEGDPSGAGAAAAQTSTGEVVGTPLYMSPEQLRATREVDHRADIYALGLILYRMLAGRGPFVKKAMADLLVAHLVEAPPPPTLFNAAIPPFVEKAILRALAKDAADRFGSVGELVEALEPVERRVFRSSALPAPRVAAASTHPPSSPTPAIAGKGAAMAAALEPTLTSSPGLPPQPAAPASSSTPASPSMPAAPGSPSKGGAGGRASRLSRELGETTGSRRRRTIFVSVGAVVVVAIGLATGWFWTLRAATPGSASGRGTGSPSGAVEPLGPGQVPVTLGITTRPASARILLDGAVLQNPFRGRFARSEIGRHLRVTAPGHREEARWIVLNQDRNVDIVLEPAGAAATTASADAGASGSATSTDAGAVADAAVSASVSASTVAAESTRKDPPRRRRGGRGPAARTSRSSAARPPQTVDPGARPRSPAPRRDELKLDSRYDP